jgi:DNA helicase HerA-like ATPase
MFGREIGLVVEVDGSRAIIEMTVDTTQPVATDYYPGEPGTHIKIPIRGRSIVGTVAGIRVVGNGGNAPRKILAECLLIGSIDDAGHFTRGVAVYPNVGHRVELLTQDELRGIFSEFYAYDFAFGGPAQAPDQRAYIHADRFFSRHVAILGTTGCGKSWTVASILQNINRRYPDTHVIVFDLHGEYSAAFPDDMFLIETDKVELPYWLMNFSEFEDLSVDRAETTASNQLSVLRDAILRARQITDRKRGLGLGSAVTVDSPIYYEIDDLMGFVRGYNIQMTPTAEGRMEKGPLYGIFDRFMIRFEGRLNDPRFRFMFAPTHCTDNDSILGLLKEYLSIDTGKKMAVVDLSGVPSDAIGVVVAMVSRMVFEFNIWNPDRQKFPVLMVYEEAHNYIPREVNGLSTAASRAVERIAKEGRKYGVGAFVISQRPKELSETVLSQCNSFIVMRVSNPDDQNYVRSLLPGSLTELMEMLPALPTGEAMVLGDSIPMPTRVVIDPPNPPPMSSDVEFARNWTEGLKDIDVGRIVARWRARSKDM